MATLGALKQTWLGALLATFAFLHAPEAQAYLARVHYWTTLIEAAGCGLPDAEDIAWASFWVDYNRETTPIGGDPHDLSASNWTFADALSVTNYYNRRSFHFRETTIYPEVLPSGAGCGEMGCPPVFPKEEVVPNSSESRFPLDVALSEADPDPIAVGAAVHTHQDSWSHEGFSAKWGHLSDWRRCDNPAQNVFKSRAMNIETWNDLNRYSLAKFHRPCRNTSDLVLSTLSQLNARGMADYEDDSPWREAYLRTFPRKQAPLDPADQGLQFLADRLTRFALRIKALDVLPIGAHPIR